MLLYYVSSFVKLPSQGLSINPLSLMTAQFYEDPSKKNPAKSLNRGWSPKLSLFFSTGWVRGKLLLQFISSIFVTHPTQNPKDAFKSIIYVDFVGQRNKNTVIQIGISG